MAAQRIRKIKVVTHMHRTFTEVLISDNRLVLVHILSVAFSFRTIAAWFIFNPCTKNDSRTQTVPQLAMVIFPAGVPEADPLFSTILTMSIPSRTSPTKSGSGLVLATVSTSAGQRRLTEDDVGTIEPRGDDWERPPVMRSACSPGYNVSGVWSVPVVTKN